MNKQSIAEIRRRMPAHILLRKIERNVVRAARHPVKHRSALVAAFFDLREFRRRVGL